MKRVIFFEIIRTVSNEPILSGFVHSKSTQREAIKIVHLNAFFRKHSLLGNINYCYMLDMHNI